MTRLAHRNLPWQDDNHMFSSNPEIRKAEVRKVLDEFVALGLVAVRTDQRGEQRYRLTELGWACRSPENWGGLQ
jgi:hypothetical protein